MARYYDITVGGQHWTSHPNGIGGPRDPGALNVELDMTVSPADTPAGTCHVRVWGVSRQLIQQANSFALQPIVVKGGMAAGLPLANPSQAGVLVQGVVQSYGGFIEGVNQGVDIWITVGGTGQVKTPGPNPAVPPLNGAFNWKKGQPLSGPLQQTLQQMFPNAKINMAISPNIVAPQDLPGYYANVLQLGTMIRRVSQMILGPGSQGVSIVPFGNVVNVYDGSQTQKNVQIEYADLIGLPTWVDIGTILVKCVMRADISLGTSAGLTITLPQGVVVTGQSASGNQINTNALAGTFQVVTVRHVGNFRQPDGSAWVSIITASSNTPLETAGVS